jgi:hypothetical protein
MATVKIPTVSLVDIRDKDGRRLEIDRIEDKYYITIDGVMVQTDLSANATIRWMGNCMHVEPKLAQSVNPLDRFKGMDHGGF